MHYQGTVYRPPSEAFSILLQITTGCSYNKCSFCEMYKKARFSIKEIKTIMADIDFAAIHCQNQRKLFLCDGDALIVPHQKMLHILQSIQQKLPWLARVATYANAKSVQLKSDKELKELFENGLTMAYVGLESGDDPTLAAINKGANSQQIIEQCRRLQRAGFKLSLTVLLGIAGRKRSHIHAAQTGRVLSAINPKFIGALSLIVTPGTPLFDEVQAGKFELPDRYEMLEELAIMIAETDLSAGIFHANHASNYLPVKARLPKDKKRVLQQIGAALAGKTQLKPEHLRGL